MFKAVSHAISDYRPFLLILLISGMTVAAFCQTRPGQKSVPVPDYVLYDSFFNRVTMFEKFADSQERVGRDGASLRSAIRREARLSAREDEALNRIASHWREQSESYLADLRALAERSADPGASPELKGLQERRRQAVMDDLARLRAVLGEKTFKRLDSYVRRTSSIQMPASVPAPIR